MSFIIYNNLTDDNSEWDDADLNASLGRFMTAWSELESVCGFIFRALAGIGGETSQIIFDRIGAREQIDIVTALGALGQSEASRLPEQMGQVSDISIARNKIVHAGWGVIDHEPARFWHGITSSQFDEIAHRTERGKSYRKKFIFTVADIDILTAMAKALRQGLMEALRQIDCKTTSKETAFFEMRRAWSEERHELFLEIERLNIELHKAAQPQPSPKEP